MDFLATWRVIDLITAPARRIQQAARIAQAAMDRAARAMGGSFNHATSSVNSLRAQIDALRTTRDSLRVHVDTSQIANANRQLLGLQRELDRVERRNRRADGSGGGGSGGLIGMMSKRLLPLLAVSTLAGGIGNIIKGGMEREAGQVDYSQFLGKKNGAMVYEQMNKFANDTIFNNQDVLTAGARAANQFKANQVLPQIKMYGDLTGGDGDKLKRLTTIIGKVKETGVLQGDESEQLNEIGIFGLNAQISKLKGVGVSAFRKLREDGKISFQDVQNALITMTSKGGMYYQFLENKSQTTWGKMQKLVGNVESQFKKIGQAKLPILNDILDWANKFTENWKPIGDAFGNLIRSFSPLWIGFKQILSVFGLIPKEGDSAITTINIISITLDKLAIIFGFVGSVFNNLVTGMRMLPFGDIVVKILSIWAATQFLGGITGIFNSVKVAWLALNAGFLATPIGWIVVGIVALVAALTYAWQNSEKFREVVVRSWEGIKAVWGTISETFMAVWDSVVFWWTKISQFIEGLWLMTKDYVVKKFYEMYEPVRPYVDAIVRAFNFVKEKVGGVWDWIGDKIQSTFEKVTNFLKPFAEIIKKVVSFTPIGLAVAGGKMAFDAVGGLYDKFQTGYNSKAANKAALGVKEKPKSFFDNMANGIGGMSDDGSGGAGGSGKGAGSGISDTVEGVKSRTINITIKNMIETINNNVSSEAVGKKVSDDVLDTLNRLFSSADRLAFE